MVVHLSDMNPARQTTAKAIQAGLQPQLHEHLDDVSSGWQRLRNRIRAWIHSRVEDHFPYGYEDGEGFHLGHHPQDRLPS